MLKFCYKFISTELLVIQATNIVDEQVTIYWHYTESARAMHAVVQSKKQF